MAATRAERWMRRVVQPELSQLMHGSATFTLRQLYAGGRNVVFEACAPRAQRLLTALLTSAADDDERMSHSVCAFLGPRRR